MTQYITHPSDLVKTVSNMILNAGEHELLDEALCHWQDPSQFSDDQVLSVKSVFRRIFELPEDTVLAGSTLPDAIILQSPSDTKTYFVIMQKESPEQGWEALELKCEGNIAWAKNTPFRLVMFFLTESSGGVSWTMK
jgi:hypothetical protein